VRRHPWFGRAILAGFLVLASVAGALYEHTRPDLPKLILMCGLGVAGISLIIDMSATENPDWEVVSARSVMPIGQDAALSRDVRLLENHLTSRAVEPVLRRRLTMLTDARLTALGLERDDPAVRARLGPTLCQVIDSEPRTLSRATIDECLRRIEELE
jgi:hypothetical protein